jgi:hypothetical protein
MRVLALTVFLALTHCGCSGQPSPAIAPRAIAEPDEPLAEEARALPAGHARVELTRSRPAGPGGDQAEYEWTILARVAAPPAEAAPASSAEPGWVVARLTLLPRFEARYDDLSFDADRGPAPRAGRRHVNLLVRCQAVRFLPGQVGGRRETSGEARPGSVLHLDRGGWLGPAVDGKYSEVPALRDLLEVQKAPLDGLVQPLLRGPETVALPGALDLLRVGDRTTALEIAR